MIGTAESEHARLIRREIIFKVFQPMWPRYLNVTDERTDKKTDGWCSVPIAHYV